MNALAAVLALLAVAFLGGFFSRGRRTAGNGLASGAEWVVLGFVAGPSLLGILTGDVVGLLTPLAGAGVTWVAVVVGLDWGWVDDRRISNGRRLASVLLALPPFAAVGAAVAALLAWQEGTPYLATRDQVLIAGGVAAALAGTTRNALRWAAERHGARGPVSDLLHDLTDADDLFPILVLAVLAAPDAAGLLRASPAGLAGAAAASLAVGGVVGLATALLVRFDARRDAMAAALLGTSLVVVGLTTRLGLSLPAAGFALGWAAAGASGVRGGLRALAVRLERPILLPTLVLAGALVVPAPRHGLPAVVGGALAALLLGKLVSALLLRVAVPAVRPAGFLLGPALTTPGSLGACIGLAAALDHPGPAGQTVLACAAAAVVLGEVLSPLALRAALVRVGACAPADAPTAGAVEVPR